MTLCNKIINASDDGIYTSISSLESGVKDGIEHLLSISHLYQAAVNPRLDVAANLFTKWGVSPTELVELGHEPISRCLMLVEVGSCQISKQSPDFILRYVHFERGSVIS